MGDRRMRLHRHPGPGLATASVNSATVTPRSGTPQPSSAAGRCEPPSASAVRMSGVPGRVAATPRSCRCSRA